LRRFKFSCKAADLFKVLDAFDVGGHHFGTYARASAAHGVGGTDVDAFDSLRDPQIQPGSHRFQRFPGGIALVVGSNPAGKTDASRLEEAIVNRLRFWDDSWSFAAQEQR
jgi:hypothetical protein